MVAHFGYNLVEAEEVEVFGSLRLVSEGLEDIAILFANTTSTCNSVQLLTKELFVE